jgi:hypothetical protein
LNNSRISPEKLLAVNLAGLSLLNVQTAEKCWEFINTQKSTKELARTALLLTFLCLVYDEAQELCKNRATLDNDAIDILLRR